MSGNITKSNRSRIVKREMHTHVHSCTAHSSQLETPPNVHRWVDRERKGGIYTQWSKSALRKKDILTYPAAQMTLEDITLSEISQSEKDTFCMIPLIQDI